MPDISYLDALVDDEKEIPGLKAVIDANLREREIKSQWTKD